MIEKWWRKWRLDRRLKSYRKLENKGAGGDDFAEAFEWIAGNWTREMISIQPSWVLETRLLVGPGLDQRTVDRITEELAQRQASRAQKLAWLSMAVSLGSMLIALGAWLVKSPF